MLPDSPSLQGNNAHRRFTLSTFSSATRRLGISVPRAESCAWYELCTGCDNHIDGILWDRWLSEQSSCRMIRIGIERFEWWSPLLVPRPYSKGKRARNLASGSLSTEATLSGGAPDSSRHRLCLGLRTSVACILFLVY